MSNCHSLHENYHVIKVWPRLFINGETVLGWNDLNKNLYQIRVKFEFRGGNKIKYIKSQWLHI